MKQKLVRMIRVSLLITTTLAILNPPASTSAGNGAAVVLPVTEAKLVRADDLQLSDVLKKPAGIKASFRETLHWRVPEALAPGEYYVGFRIIQKKPWHTGVYPLVHHNAHEFRVIELTDPVPMDQLSHDH